MPEYPRNMRSVGKDDGLDDLAASMRERLARGLPPLIHNLRGCRVSAKKIEIHAGGRRLAALLRLRGEAVIPASFPVPVELDDPADAVEISIMENQLRLPPHPYDQFTGFRRLAEQGLDPERIAQRFGARASWVRQRLALAALHPDLLELLKRDELPVACAQALTLTADRERQLECWTRLPSWQRDARSIRRLLRDAAIPVAAALFPVADYLAAGGVIERDLFDERDQGAIASTALFAAMQRAEVIECDPGPGWYHYVREMDLEEMACAGERGLSAEEAAERDRLLARADELRGLPEAASAAERDAYDAKLDTIERRLEALDALGKTRIYRPDQRAAGVVLVLFSPPGSLVIREGLTRRAGACGEPAPSPGLDGANDNAAGPPRTPEPHEDIRAGKPYASAVLRSLAAAKSHALQDLVSGDPEMALRIAVHHLIDGGYRLNSGHDGYAPVGLRLAEHACAEDNRVLNDGLREVLDRIGLSDPAPHTGGGAPPDPERWRAVLEAPYPLVLQAFALLVARGVGADAETMRSPDLYAAVAVGYGLRMADRWRPDAAFLGGLTRAQLHAILTGNRLGELSERWRECRKPDLVGHLARLFDGNPPAGCGPSLQAACLELVASWVPTGLDYAAPDGQPEPETAAPEAAE